MSDVEKVIQRTAGLLGVKGFRLKKGDDDNYIIVNQAGNNVASGKLATMYYAAVILANDPDSERLQDELPDTNEARQRGREMGQRLKELLK